MKRFKVPLAWITLSRVHGFAEVSKNFTRYKSENKFIGIIKVIM